MRLGTLGLLIVLAIRLPTSVVAQQGDLAGTVREADGGRPIGDAQIFLPELGRSVLALSGGSFTIEGLDVGTWRLEVSRVGYRRVLQEVVIEEDTTVVVAIEMPLAPVALEGVNVEAESESFVPGFVRRQRVREAYFFTRADIAAMEPERLSQVVERLYGVEVDYDPLEGWTVRVWNEERFSRGDPRYCVPNLILNGRLRPEWWALNNTYPGEVLAMEVYWRASEVPDEFDFISETQAMNRRCGAIAVWTELERW